MPQCRFNQFHRPGCDCSAGTDNVFGEVLSTEEYQAKIRKLDEVTNMTDLHDDAQNDYGSGIARLYEGAADVLDFFNSEPPATVDMVHHPRHYNVHPSGVECIDITRHMAFSPGNAVKYVWRAPDKGNPHQDLDKARWYLCDTLRHAHPIFILGGYRKAAPLLDVVAQTETDPNRSVFFTAIRNGKIDVALSAVNKMLSDENSFRATR